MQWVLHHYFTRVPKDLLIHWWKEVFGRCGSTKWTVSCWIWVKGCCSSCRCRGSDLEKLHCLIGHILPDAARELVKEEIFDGFTLNEASKIESCNSCKYGKAHCKAIGKKRVAPWASNIGDEVLHFSLYYTFTPLLLNPFHYYLITLLQGHVAKHTVTLWLTLFLSLTCFTPYLWLTKLLLDMTHELMTHRLGILTSSYQPCSVAGT